VRHPPQRPTRPGRVVLAATLLLLGAAIATAGENPGTLVGENPGAASENPGTSASGENPGTSASGENPGTSASGENPGTLVGSISGGSSATAENPGTSGGSTSGGSTSGGSSAAAAENPGTSGENPGTLVVGSKNFEESRLLAEVFAQLIEDRTGLRVERRLNLAGTAVCFEALRSGAIDLYPEYTGTGLVSLLGLPPAGDATATLGRVRREFLARWDLWWLAPLGFENAYEIAVRRQIAEEHGLKTISDLAPLAPELRAGLGFEFVERADGLPGLEAAYGLHFASVQPMQQALKYQAAGAGRIDVLDVYTTDGRLLLNDLVVLADDRGFFPPYEAAALVRGETLRRHPEVGAALGLLAGAFDEQAMRGFNLRLQQGHEEPAAVARDALGGLGLLRRPAGGEPPAATGGGLGAYLWRQRRSLARLTGQHLALSAAALALGVLVALPLGLALTRARRLAEPLIRAVGVTQTIPSIALLAFMIPLLGVGALPAVVALWIYSLFPILRNTYTGLRDADPRAVEASTALGMTPLQVLGQIRLPLAAPVIMAGVRTAGVLTVGTATLAAFIGAGGLGQPIVTGLQLADSRMILSGALPAALLTLAVDGALAALEAAVRPRGLGDG
jgi:osmoprotectant transport system substrate-binding protein/osmoprotectant transport system permease protein